MAMAVALLISYIPFVYWMIAEAKKDLENEKVKKMKSYEKNNR